jgi:xylulokinase
MGGAMLAMVACGEYASVKDCCEALCGVASTVKPEPELVAKYEARYQQFRKIYPTLKALFPEIQ